MTKEWRGISGAGYMADKYFEAPAVDKAVLCCADNGIVTAGALCMNGR